MKKTKILGMILTICMVVCMFGCVALADINVTTDWQADDTLSSKLNSPISSILTVISVIAGAVAVGMLIYIGIKYMTKGAGGKAEVKDTLMPYLIGAILVGGASTLANVAISMGSK